MAPSPSQIFARFPTFAYNQFFVTPPLPTRSFAGETVIITGSNTGLGLEAAKHIARLNAAHLIIAVRSTAKGETAKSTVQKANPSSNTKIEVWPLDLGSYQSVKEFAHRCQSLPRLDAVIENAGINTSKYVVAEDNESTITVNVVSTFLLALLLLPKLRETASRHNTVPRLSIVSSDVQFFTDFRERNATRGIFTELNDPKTADMVDRYNVSKILEVCTVRELAEKMKIAEQSAGKPHVILNTLTPGFCHSELVREASGGLAIFLVLLKAIFARTTEVGGRTLVAGATAGEESHGKYMEDCVVARCAPLIEGPEGPGAQKRVWGELSEKLERIQPGILKNI